jgi:hypothetical protein
MLALEERELLIDAVRPDPGYALDHALITTYSLDLDALLAIPVALTFSGWSGEEEDRDNSPREGPVDPVALLESLRRHADRLTVLCQTGAIVAPRNGGFLSFLEPVVHGVTAPRGGVFHPKLWLLRYLPMEDGAPIRYRLLCLSRNLTFDRSWDSILRLDASLAEHRSRGYGPNRPLQRFVSAMVELGAEAQVSLNSDRVRALETIAAEAARLRFELPEGVDECRLWPLGIDGVSAGDVFGGRRDRTLVVSPFVSQSLLDQLGLGEEDMLVSGIEELAGLPAALRDRIGCIRVMDGVTTAELDSTNDVEVSPAATSEDGLSGLHAKLFVADVGWNARIWTGSANATGAAFESNVEFVVELIGKKSGLGIEKVLGSDQDGLAKLLVPYEHDPADALDQEERRLEHVIDRLAQELGASPLSLRASSKGSHWRMELHCDGQIPPFPDGLDVAVWPATLQEHRARPLVARSDLPSWEGLDLVQLTGFLCLEISAASADVRRQVAIAIPLEGAPADRDAAVVRSVLADSSRVLRYLLFLLGDHDTDAADAFEMLTSDSGEDTEIGAWLGLGADATLFEALVRSLHRDPDRIQRVESLIRDLGEDGARDLLPDGFEAFFGSVREAGRRLRQR